MALGRGKSGRSVERNAFTLSLPWIALCGYPGPRMILYKNRRVSTAVARPRARLRYTLTVVCDDLRVLRCAHTVCHTL